MCPATALPATPRHRSPGLCSLAGAALRPPRRGALGPGPRLPRLLDTLGLLAATEAPGAARVTLGRTTVSLALARLPELGRLPAGAAGRVVF